jgi:hypothetical protein
MEVPLPARGMVYFMESSVEISWFKGSPHVRKPPIFQCDKTLLRARHSIWRMFWRSLFHRIHGAAIYGNIYHHLPSIYLIYPIYVSINIPAPWIRHGYLAAFWHLCACDSASLCRVDVSSLCREPGESLMADWNFEIIRQCVQKRVPRSSKSSPGLLGLKHIKKPMVWGYPHLSFALHMLLLVEGGVPGSIDWWRLWLVVIITDVAAPRPADARVSRGRSLQHWQH